MDTTGNNILHCFERNKLRYTIIERAKPKLDNELLIFICLYFILWIFSSATHCFLGFIHCTVLQHIYTSKDRKINLYPIPVSIISSCKQVVHGERKCWTQWDFLLCYKLGDLNCSCPPRIKKALEQVYLTSESCLIHWESLDLSSDGRKQWVLWGGCGGGI